MDHIGETSPDSDLLYSFVSVGQTEDCGWIRQAFGCDCHPHSEFGTRMNCLGNIHHKIFCEAFPSFRNLSNEDKLSFVKALAMVEILHGGAGSPTRVYHLLLEVPDDTPRRQDLVDLLLRDYPHFYYAGRPMTREGVRKKDEHDRIHRAAAFEKDKERHILAQQKKAPKATQDLFGAIRRSDVKAVGALIAKGANVNASSPNGGRTVLEFARSKGNETIVSLIEEAISKEVDVTE